MTTSLKYTSNTTTNSTNDSNSSCMESELPTCRTIIRDLMRHRHHVRFDLISSDDNQYQQQHHRKQKYPSQDRHEKLINNWQNPHHEMAIGVANNDDASLSSCKSLVPSSSLVLFSNDSVIHKETNTLNCSTNKSSRTLMKNSETSSMEHDNTVDMASDGGCSITETTMDLTLSPVSAKTMIHHDDAMLHRCIIHETTTTSPYVMRKKQNASLTHISPSQAKHLVMQQELVTIHSEKDIIVENSNFCDYNTSVGADITKAVVSESNIQVQFAERTVSEMNDIMDWWSSISTSKQQLDLMGCNTTISLAARNTFHDDNCINDDTASKTIDDENNDNRDSMSQCHCLLGNSLVFATTIDDTSSTKCEIVINEQKDNGGNDEKLIRDDWIAKPSPLVMKMDWHEASTAEIPAIAGITSTPPLPPFDVGNDVSESCMQAQFAEQTASEMKELIKWWSSSHHRRDGNGGDDDDDDLDPVDANDDTITSREPRCDDSSSQSVCILNNSLIISSEPDECNGVWDYEQVQKNLTDTVKSNASALSHLSSYANRPYYLSDALLFNQSTTTKIDDDEIKVELDSDGIKRNLFQQDQCVLEQNSKTADYDVNTLEDVPSLLPSEISIIEESQSSCDDLYSFFLSPSSVSKSKDSFTCTPTLFPNRNDASSSCRSKMDGVDDLFEFMTPMNDVDRIGRQLYGSVARLRLDISQLHDLAEQEVDQVNRICSHVHKMAQEVTAAVARRYITSISETSNFVDDVAHMHEQAAMIVKWDCLDTFDRIKVKVYLLARWIDNYLSLILFQYVLPMECLSIWVFVVRYTSERSQLCIRRIFQATVILFIVYTWMLSNSNMKSPHQLNGCNFFDSFHAHHPKFHQGDLWSIQCGIISMTEKSNIFIEETSMYSSSYQINPIALPDQTAILL